MFFLGAPFLPELREEDAGRLLPEFLSLLLFDLLVSIMIKSSSSKKSDMFTSYLETIIAVGSGRSPITLELLVRRSPS